MAIKVEEYCEICGEELITARELQNRICDDCFDHPEKVDEEDPEEYYNSMGRATALAQIEEGFTIDPTEDEDDYAEEMIRPSDQHAKPNWHRIEDEKSNDSDLEEWAEHIAEEEDQVYQDTIEGRDDI